MNFVEVFAPTKLVSAVMLSHAMAINEQSLADVCATLVESALTVINIESMRSGVVVWGDKVMSLRVNLSEDCLARVRTIARQNDLLESQVIIMCIASAIDKS